MNAQIVTVDYEHAELSSMSTEQLKSELSNGLTMTAKVLTRLGLVWMELDRRGVDLSDLRTGISRMLPLIASGLLAAEAVVSFAGKSVILKRLIGIPLAEQRRLASGGEVEVYIRGNIEPKLLPLNKLPSQVVRQVFVDGEIRTALQQKMAIRTKDKQPKQLGQSKSKIKVCQETRMLLVGHRELPVETVIAALVEVAGGYVEVVETTDRQAKVIAAKVTDEEKERVAACAKAHGLTESELVRRAVLAMWLV